MPSADRNWYPIAQAAWRVAREDPAQGEAILREGLARHAANAGYLSVYATFLADVRGDSDGAERLFAKALEHDADGLVLNNYAWFLVGSRGDLDGAERLFRKALEQEADGLVLNNYGWFLWRYRNDADGAERLLRLAADGAHADPLSRANHKNILAVFLWDIRKDAAAAAPVFRESLDGADGDPLILAHAGRFLTATGDTAAGLALIEAALRAPAGPELAGVHLLCWFCIAAHGAPEAAEAAWDRARRLLLAGADPPDPTTDLDPNIAAAIRAGHPRPERLRALAAAMLGRAPAASLARL